MRQDRNTSERFEFEFRILFALLTCSGCGHCIKSSVCESEVKYFTLNLKITVFTSTSMPTSGFGKGGSSVPNRLEISVMISDRTSLRRA